MRTTTLRSASPIRTLPLRRIFRPTTILLRTTRRAPQVAAIAAARILAVAEIVGVTVAVAAVGAAVADANAVAGTLKAPASAGAIYLPPNMLRRKASLAETSRAATRTEVTITAAATSEVRKIAAANRVVLNRAALRSVALIIARLKLSVPPRPPLSRKNPFFSQASL